MEHRCGHFEFGVGVVCEPFTFHFPRGCLMAVECHNIGREPKAVCDAIGNSLSVDYPARMQGPESVEKLRLKFVHQRLGGLAQAYWSGLFTLCGLICGVLLCWLAKERGVFSARALAHCQVAACNDESCFGHAHGCLFQLPLAQIYPILRAS